MDAGGIVWNIVVSRDGKWIVSGTESSQVTVWNAENHEKVTEFKALRGNNWHWMRALDVSPDGTKITTGSDDKPACVWSLPTAQRLSSSWQHDLYVVEIKFSPNGNLVAAASWFKNCVRIYHSQSGHLYSDIPIKVTLSANQSLAWASDSTHLFALSDGGDIHCFDVSKGTTISKWPIRSSSHPTCIALASNETFIAVSADSLVSFWDTMSHKQIGSVIKHPACVRSIAISANHDLVVGGGKSITLRSLCDILPSPYSDHVSATASTNLVRDGCLIINRFPRCLDPPRVGHRAQEGGHD